MFRLVDIIIDITFFSINWKNYFDRSILVISMPVLVGGSSYCSIKIIRSTYEELWQVYVLSEQYQHLILALNAKAVRGMRKRPHARLPTSILAKEC